MTTSTAPRTAPSLGRRRRSRTGGTRDIPITASPFALNDPTGVRCYSPPMAWGNSERRTRWALLAFAVAVLICGCGGGSDEPPEKNAQEPNIVQAGAPGEPSRSLSAEEAARASDHAAHAGGRRLHAGDDPPPRPGAADDQPRARAQRQQGHPAARQAHGDLPGGRDRDDGAVVDRSQAEAARRGGSPQRPRPRQRADAGDGQRRGARPARGRRRPRVRPPVPRAT